MLLFQKSTKAPICDFNFSIFEQNVGRLKIAMNDVRLNCKETGIDDFPSNDGYLSLGKRNLGFEVATLTILINHKDFLFPDENLFEIYDIFMLERGEYFNFIEEKLLEFGIFFHFMGGDNLDRIFYIGIGFD